ncbi:hypothetical protein [Dyadobacter sp. LHD-138]|uniref:hypothetical protein n=1 Tax=Dyadobacter sp. LHD-138 TaxID=3071413 RepID=UPI0027DFF28C|nr:hypothetical protein [Dyadobacter sp. LHD-138]MDQ6480065.1 hypothetical protein [Dyadobacter sp. LHD-138]
MSKPKFEQGAWVKVKTGTHGMTVVKNVVDEATSEFAGEVRCRFNNAVGESVEDTFRESDLVAL